MGRKRKKKGSVFRGRGKWNVKSARVDTREREMIARARFPRTSLAATRRKEQEKGRGEGKGWEKERKRKTSGRLTLISSRKNAQLRSKWFRADAVC